MDVLGKVVYQTELSQTQTTVNLNNQSAGIYYVVLITELGSTTKKIVIEN